MKQHTRISHLRNIALFIVFSFHSSAKAQETNIPISEITSLQKELIEETSETSASKKRRALKNIIRDGNSLLDDSPTASNRFQVLDIMLKSHRRLLALDNSEKNRESLFDTCKKLAKAPDTYAELRLEADLILSEKELSEKNATLTQRVKALRNLVERYRNTAGEAKSLMMASIIAPKLEAFDLEQAMVKTLTERFQDNLEVIDFRKKSVRANLHDVVFSGTFKDNNDQSTTFPIDRIGHTSLLYFWSQKTPNLKDYFADAKDIQNRFPNQFSVYSFNLDELPDAGEKALRENGLDWKAMHLPKGTANPVFRTFIGSVPGALLINAHGHSLIYSSPSPNGSLPLIPRKKNNESLKKRGSVDKITTISNSPTLEVSLDSTRYHSQLQSLIIGDFLVAAKPQKSTSIETASLEAIQACFVKPPHRYRLSQEQALANYTKAEKLCQAVIADHPDAPDLWQVRNRRIIALLGMWNLATEPKHLEAALQEAQTNLKKNLPPEANVVPHFCIAKHELRIGKNPTTVLESFIKNTGGENAPTHATAATTILAIDANERYTHAKFRELLLQSETEDTTLWPVITFLRDRHHSYRLFHATHSRHGDSRAERHSHYRNIAALDVPADTTRIIKTALTTLDGKKTSLPEATEGKITFVSIMELPANEEAEIVQDSVIKKMTSLASQHKANGIKVIAVFLSNNMTKIKALVKKHEWSCEIAILPDGLNHSLVLEYGLLSADLTPNIFLLRPDGSISWSASGLTYRIEGGRNLATPFSYAMEAQINVLQMETAKSALDAGNFNLAIKLFSEALAPKKLKDDWWGTFRHYSRARAYVGIENWEAALADLDIAFEAHKTFGGGTAHRCELLKEMELYKADILDKLGRGTEAEALRIQATKPTTPHNKSPFGIYTENRENFRLNPHSGK